MSRTVAELAEALGARLQGDGGVRIERVSSLATATVATLAFMVGRSHLDELRSTQAGAVLLSEEWAAECRGPALIVRNPHAAFARAAAMLHPEEAVQPGIHESAVVAADAEIAAGVSIGPNVVVGSGCRIGDHAIIGPGSVLMQGARIGAGTRLVAQVFIGRDCRLGARCLIHPGAVIGADGFGFANEQGRWVKVPQVGCVQIGDDVEIGANSTIDRGTIGSTVIGDGTKIDNLVLVAHNCEIGSDCIIVANTSIGGSTKIGNRVIIAATVSIKDHTKIGDDAIVEATSGVMKDIPSRAVQVGTPACDARQYMTQLALIRRLPKMNDEVRSLKKRITQLEQLLLEKQLTK